ncbi:MAG: sulfotransferase domain-containing protein [Chloroflexota bacterium]
MRLPNFVVIGPPRTATTWLFRCLRDHPQVFVPNVKEPRYFDENYHQGLSWYLDLYKTAPATASKIGDITPGYFIADGVPERMANLLGLNIKIYIVVRNPVERAYSHYRMLTRNALVTGTFEEALEQEYSLVENSLYTKQIERFLTVFPQDSLRLLTYEQLTNNPRQYWSNFLEDLGVDYVEGSTLTKQVNKGLAEMRMPFVNRGITKIKQALASSVASREILWKMRDLGIMRLWHQLSLKTPSEFAISKDSLLQLFELHFAADYTSLNRYQNMYIHHNSQLRTTNISSIE